MQLKPAFLPLAPHPMCPACSAGQAAQHNTAYIHTSTETACLKHTHIHFVITCQMQRSRHSRISTTNHTHVTRHIPLQRRIICLLATKMRVNPEKKWMHNAQSRSIATDLDRSGGFPQRTDRC
jgi:hypothetical protein